MPTYGGNASDNTLTGDKVTTADNDSLLGYGGSDTLYGGGGSDTLDGGVGADKLYGGRGNDVYIVDNAQDLVVESAGEGDADLVRVSLASYTLTANVENLTYTGGGGFSGGGNTLANVITGGGGADTLNGGAGADTMIGGAGDDLYFVDSAADVVTEGSTEGPTPSSRRRRPTSSATTSRSWCSAAPPPPARASRARATLWATRSWARGRTTTSSPCWRAT